MYNGLDHSYLEPGAVSQGYILSVVYGRASDSGDPFSSVDRGLEKQMTYGAQALFDNCFRILNGPDSPEMSIQELDKELILYLNKTSQVESYEEVGSHHLSRMGMVSRRKPSIVFRDIRYTRSETGLVDPSMLANLFNQVRLVAQCDVKDGVSQIINFNFDEDLLAPCSHVDGGWEDEGMRHSFQVLNDAFAQGDVRLINHKKYYFSR